MTTSGDVSPTWGSRRCAGCQPGAGDTHLRGAGPRSAHRYWCGSKPGAGGAGRLRDPGV